MQRLKAKLRHFLLDVDGVLTNGQFLYDSQGKRFKVFGPDDSDALKALSQFMDISFVSSDWRGFEISAARVHDMGFNIEMVSATERWDWINQRFQWMGLAYMGDSFLDAPILAKAAYGICPKNGHPLARRAARKVTRRRGGEGAVAEAAFLLAKSTGNRLTS